MNNSLWEHNVEMPVFPALQGSCKTNVLIIGGGMAGLLCAYQLQQAGIEYILIESNRICSGITKNTTSKITSQHGLIYHKILRRFGKDVAKLYWQANENAVRKYMQISAGLNCCMEQKDNYIYSAVSMDELEQELQALQQIGIPADYITDLPLPFPTLGAVCFRNQAQFDPLKFAAAISQDLHIFEHTEAKEVVGNKVIFERGEIAAQNIIVATHFPFLNKHGGYFLKLYQHRSYVLALENAQNLNGMYLSAEANGLSFRNFGDYLLLGGYGHRTGLAGSGWKPLEEISGKYYPNAIIKYRWAAQDCMTLDGLPYIGQYSKRLPHVFVATGFQKWGMTTSMVAASVLLDLILQRENPYQTVFSPSRNMIRPQLFMNMYESAKNLLTPTQPRCPHLGCALKWNPQEHSWDCPCHGSRFTEQGRLLDNPATGDLKNNEKCF